MRLATIRRLVPCAGLAALLLAGGQAQAIEWGNIFGGSGKPEQPIGGQKEEVGCPDIQILDGQAGHRVPAGSSGASVRYQFSIRDVARECATVGGSLTIKVGVEGFVALGPAGAPGTFVAPLRLVIVDEHTQKTVTSKALRVSVAIPAGQAQNSFIVVADPIAAPLRADADTAYTVKVGFGAGGGEDKPAKSKRKRKPAAEE
mgnify:CR=1 FL=1